jgi:predicted TIM-barrel fold metal-dependent hydrolase
MFDSLVHTSSDGSWLGGRRYDASLDRLLLEMDRAGVERACLVAIAGYIDNQTVLEHAAADRARFVPIGSINPVACTSVADVEDAIDDLAAAGFRGLKLHPRLNDYDPIDERCLAAIARAGQTGLIVLLDTLFRQPSRPVAHPVDTIDRIIKTCPGTRIVLLHSAGPAMLDLFELGRLHSTILLDLSFSLLRYRGSSLDQDMAFLIRHLDQRVVIGSDFPEYTPREVLARLDELVPDLPVEKRQAVLYGNLDRTFPKSPAGGS